MDPFLKPERGWWERTPHLFTFSHYHTDENEAIEEVVNAIAKMRKVFGHYQAKAMIENELDHGPAADSYHPIVCHDGTKISAQAREGSMCIRKAKLPVYTSVEVLVHGALEPRCLSARELMALIAEHGGIKYGHLPPLDFGRDPALGDRNDDDDAVDYAMRFERKRKCISHDKELKFPVTNWHFEEFSESDNSQSGVIVPVTKCRKVTRYRVRAADPCAYTTEEQSERCFTTSKIVGAHRHDGVHILETLNSVYTGRESDRLVAKTNLKVRDDGTIHASIMPTPVVVC